MLPEKKRARLRNNTCVLQCFKENARPDILAIGSMIARTRHARVPA